MEKKEFQKRFKAYMKELGFCGKGNIYWKYVDDDYLISLALDHYPYDSAYGIEYGVVYEASQLNIPFNGVCDWGFNFQFTVDPADNLKNYPLEDYLNRNAYRELTDWFNYRERSWENFVVSMEENIKRCLSQVYDKNYVLNDYRNHWTRFRRVPCDTVRKICRLAGLDVEEVIRFRDGY